MKKSSLLLALSLLAPMAQADITPIPVNQCLHISDPLGRAGMAAVVLPPNERHDIPVIMMTGGANFPHALPRAKTPAERGPKVFYKDISIIHVPGSCPTCDDSPMPVGELPAPNGYAAFAASPGGMVVAGGCNADGHVATVTITDMQNDKAVTTELPSLPVTLAYPAFTVVDNVLYVLGGQEKADSTTCIDRCFSMDLTKPQDGWKELAPMPSPRMLAAAGAVDGKIYVAGGCSLHPDANGQAERTYLNSVLCYDPATNTWTDTKKPCPETIVGAANPMPSVNGVLYLVCGDPGNYYRASLKGKAPARHPGQNVSVYSFTPKTGKWTREGDAFLGIATAPAVESDSFIYVISGETHPGIRTPLISTLQITQ